MPVEYQESDMPTLQELLDQKADLDRRISDAKKESRAGAIAQIRTIMTEHGLTEADLATPMRKGAAGTGTRYKVAAKYRHPGSGATWSGRGLKPKWLTEQLASGSQVSDFAI